MVRHPKGHQFRSDADTMQYALQLARQGIGCVEPNPAVAAVIVDDHYRLIADGWHQKFGEAHAETHALQSAGSRARGAWLFVTLEPCCHFGKTPPCADAVIAAGLRRVVVGCRDPAPHVAGQGIARLQAAGITVDVGICQPEAESLIRPFEKLFTTGRPWVHAKWAMTLDGRIAAYTGHSRWISSQESRAEVHRLRRRMDAIITGAGTVRKDDPLLTVRPEGLRIPMRVVVDRDGASVGLDSLLVKSLNQAPLLICLTDPLGCSDHLNQLRDLGAEILVMSGADRHTQVELLLKELGRRRMTHVLLEAGPGLMGSFFDQDLIDEVHVFVAPKLVGGSTAIAPIGGMGRSEIPPLESLTGIEVRQISQDVLIEGRIRRETACDNRTS